MLAIMQAYIPGLALQPCQPVALLTVPCEQAALYMSLDMSNSSALLACYPAVWHLSIHKPLEI